MKTMIFHHNSIKVKTSLLGSFSGLNREISELNAKGHEPSRAENCSARALAWADKILKIKKSHKSKSKPCFEILGNKSFRWHLETWENHIGSIFKLNVKKSCQIQKKIWHYASWTLILKFTSLVMSTPPPVNNSFIIARGWWWHYKGRIFWNEGSGGMVPNYYWNLTTFLIFNSKILPIWFSQIYFQNFVRSCQHIGGTLYI